MYSSIADEEKQPLQPTTTSSTAASNPYQHQYQRKTTQNDKFKVARTPGERLALRVLTAVVWFSMVCFGLFAALHYVRRAFLTKTWDTMWDLTDLHLYRPTKPAANYMMATHLAAGSLLMMAGPIQLIPYMRKHFLEAHRWTGRLYVIAALVVSGCATTWVICYRTSRRDIYEDVGNVLFGVAMFVSAVQSYRHVKFTKNIEAHKWWSYRLFAVVWATVLFRLYMGVYLVTVLILPAYTGTAWIYESIYFTFCLPNLFVLYIYQKMGPPKEDTAKDAKQENTKVIVTDATSLTKNTTTSTPSSFVFGNDSLRNMMHSASLFWACTVFVSLTTLLMLVFDWVPSILGIDIGQADGVEHPF